MQVGFILLYICIYIYIFNKIVDPQDPSRLMNKPLLLSSLLSISLSLCLFYFFGPKK